MRDLKKLGLLTWLVLAIVFPSNIRGQQLPPRLDIQTASSGHVIVQWPVGDGLYALEERAAFNQGIVWQPASQAPLLLSATFKVELAPTDHTRFFRLSQIVQPDPGVVPEPAGQASVPPPNMAESFSDSTSFLYSGTNSVQLGVAPGTIVPQRASVVRGRVLKRDGSPLPGVHVRVLNHPELGFTYTRADGMFDLGVNGGPQYTIDFQLRGYCPAQRQIDAPVQDFRCLEDVMLVSADPIATVVNFGTAAPLQVAKSTVNTDKAGSRSATVLFPPGTCATVLMPDGSTQNCAGLTIRATEFTVGPNGLKAMPGPLPPTSAYTYAVELSGDEATAAGAKSVKFNQFVHVYVDNFLEIPTGGLVPNAYYDRDLAAWVPQENGVVIKILDTRSGTAVIDMDGDNVPENDALLAIAQFTDQELKHLAANFPAGKSLWRMPVSHFTAFDFNCPVNPEDPGKPNTPGDKGKSNGSDKADRGGAVDLVSQIFEETIPLVGVPMNLHYSSARVPGYKVDSEVTLPLTGDPLFPNLIKVGMDFEIAGHLTEFSYPARTNVSDTYGWNGFDAYGRLVNGTRVGHFRMFYYYPSVYGGHALLARAGVTAVGYGPPLFGNYGQFKSTIGHNEAGQAVSISFDRKFTIPDHRKLGLGGWSLTPLHNYDPAARVLYRGDGNIERPEGLVNGISATRFENLTINHIAAASDGSFFLDTGNLLYKKTSAGQLVPMTALSPSGKDVVVGYGNNLRLVDGLPASRVFMAQVNCIGLAVGPDDSVYYRTYLEILRFTPDGILHVVLGKTGALNFSEDGTFARDSYASGNGEGKGLAVGPDGSVYYSDVWDLAGKRYDFLRKIAPDGRLYTLAGKGGRKPSEGIFPNQPTGYGEPAVNSKTDGIQHVGVGPDGSVYYSDYFYALNRITPGGILEIALYGRPVTQAGFPGKDDNGPLDKEISEGKLAVGRDNPAQGNASIPAVYNFKVGSDGTVYILTSQSQWFLWKIDAAGYLQRVAGKWYAPYDDTGGNPLESSLGDPYDFTLDKAGAITFVTRPQGRGGPFSLRRIGPPLPGFDAAELRVASRDGSELYVFNDGGLHQRTVDTLTGHTNWLFGYNSSNLVTTIRDRDGLITSIERDAGGNPTALLGPYGQRTTLSVDPAGFLSTVTNPNQERAQLTHGSSGLLTSIIGPRENSFAVTYDDQGRATRMGDPLGGFTAVQYSDEGGIDYSTATTTGAGDQSTRVVKLAANGDSVVVTTQPDGTIETKVLPVAGGLIQTKADGTVLTQTMARDPRFPSQTLIPASTVITFPGGLQSSLSSSRSATFNQPGNPLSLSNIQATINLNGQVFTQTYDAASNRLTILTPEGRQNQFDFDSTGRLIGGQFATDSSISKVYDASGKLSEINTSAGGALQSRHFAYNALGLLDQLTDPIGRSVHFAYDGAGRLKRVVLPEGGILEFEQDAENQLTGVKPAGRPMHQFAYDAVGSVKRYSPPVVLTDDSIQYAYDSDRTLTNIVFPDGRIWALELNPGGRPRQLNLSSGLRLSFRYNAVTGQLTNVSNTFGQAVTFGYQGSLPVLTLWSGVVTGAVALEFNANLQLAAHSVNGQRLAYAYDRDGLLTEAGELQVTRDAASGRITVDHLGIVNEELGYDDAGRLTNQTVAVGTATFLTASLKYDRLNRLTNRIETSGSTTHEYAYLYDIAGHLQETRRDGAVLAAYTYDANGNRLTRNGETATYDAQDRLVDYAEATFAWSRNGNRTSRTTGGVTTTYDYDLQGGLRHVETPALQLAYVLDPLGRRVGRIVEGVLERGWLWLDHQIVAELDSSSTLTKRFIYGANRFAPAFMITGTNSYRMITDERGSIRFVINTQDGTVAQAIDYDEFGRVLSDSNPGFQPFGFAGGQYDPGTGLVRFAFRDYDPETGQWTARDPIFFAGGQYSLYAYLHNEPINFIDPMGTGPYRNSYASRFSPHQRRILAEADRKIARNARQASILAQIDKNDIELLKDIGQEFVEEAWEHVGLGVVDFVGDVVTVTEKGGQIIGETANELTGNGLNRAQSSAKGVDLRGPAAKQRPFSVFNP